MVSEKSILFFFVVVKRLENSGNVRFWILKMFISFSKPMRKRFFRRLTSNLLIHSEGRKIFTLTLGGKGFSQFHIHRVISASVLV